METNNIDLRSVLDAVQEPQREFLQLVRRPDALEVLHCNGCHNHCALCAPNCGRGKRAAGLVSEYRTAVSNN